VLLKDLYGGNLKVVKLCGIGNFQLLLNILVIILFSGLEVIKLLEYVLRTQTCTPYSNSILKLQSQGYKTLSYSNSCSSGVRTQEFPSMLCSLLRAVLQINMAAHRRIQHRLLHQNQQVLRRPRLFRDRMNPLEVYDEDEVFSRYRFRPQTIYYILSVLPNLNHPTKRNNPLPPLLQLLVCLRFLATGAIHLLIGDSLNISRSTAGRCIRAVSGYFTELRRRFIKFPTGNVALQTKRGFSTIAGMFIFVSSGCYYLGNGKKRMPSVYFHFAVNNVHLYFVSAEPSNRILCWIYS
jgi:hypothetical protein